MPAAQSVLQPCTQQLPSQLQACGGAVLLVWLQLNLPGLGQEGAFHCRRRSRIGARCAGASWDGVAYGSLGGPGRLRLLPPPFHVCRYAQLRVAYVCGVVCGWCASGVQGAPMKRLPWGGGSARIVYGKVHPDGVCFAFCVHRRVSCRSSIHVGPYSGRRQPFIEHSLHFSHGRD